MMKKKKRENLVIEREAVAKLIKMLTNIGDHPRETKASGAVRSEPDILTPYGIFESKGTDSKSFSINKDLINKLLNSSIAYDGLPALFINTKDISFFVVDTTTFMVLWKLYLTGTKSKEIEEAEKHGKEKRK